MLAPSFVTITRAPEGGRSWVEAPGIVTLPSGNLMATVQICDRNDLRNGWVTRILKSADNGQSWTVQCEKPWFEVSPMVVRNKLYMFVLPRWNEWMGESISIVQSRDEGRTWTEPVALVEGSYWTIPMGKTVKGDTCYVGINVGTWQGGPGDGAAPVVVHVVDNKPDAGRTLAVSATALGFGDYVKATLYTPVPYDKQLHATVIKRAEELRGNNMRGAKQAEAFAPLRRSAPLELTTRDDKIIVKLPKLDVWGVVVFERINR